MRYRGQGSRLACLLGTRRWCLALLGMVILWCLGLVSANTGSASSTPADSTAVTVDWSGTFSSSYEVSELGGVMTQAINLTWTAIGAFNYQGQQVTPSQRTTLQVTGTMTETDTSSSAPTLQDNCTAQLSAIPSMQYTNLGLLDATVGQYPPDTGVVNASASVPAGPETPSPFIQTNGTGDCATFHMDTTGALPKGHSAIDWLSTYGGETATFNEKQQPSYSANYGPYSDDQTAGGNSTFTAHISDTLAITTTTCAVGTDTARAGSEGNVDASRGSNSQARSADASSITPVYYYSSRGSSESLQDGLGLPGRELFKHLKQGANTNLTGHVNLYPAADIDGGLVEDWDYIVDAKEKRRPPGVFPYLGRNYNKSVTAGVRSGVADLSVLAAQQTTCKWFVVLTGYSQGAEVTRRIVLELAKSHPDILQHVAAVVLFGDPYFTPNEPGVTTQPGFAPGSRGVRRVLPTNPLSVGMPVQTFSYCRRLDAVCAAYPTIGVLLSDLNKLWSDLRRGDTISSVRDLLGLITERTKLVSGHFDYGKDACSAAKRVSEALKAKGANVDVSGC